MQVEVVLHPDREALADAAMTEFPLKDSERAALVDGLGGFLAMDDRTIHTLQPRHVADRERIYNVGHEVLHVLCGDWHGRKESGWSD